MRSTVLALPLAAVLSVLALAPAQAESTTVRDGAGDVWAATDDGTGGHEPAGSVTNTDLRRLRVDHTATDLVAQATLVDLRRGASSFADLRLSVQSPSRTFVVLVTTPDDLRGASVLVTADGADGADVACPQAGATVSPGRETISLRVPRTCLGDPAWVRWRAQVESFQYRVGTYVDDALSDRAASRRWSARLTAG